MARNHSNWLEAFVQYASIGEAPEHLLFWTGVSTIAGALQRKVWFDQLLFQWFPNFYVVIVAPPGIVSKSTTADVGMSLLRRVEGVKFGPNVVTWQALVTAFSEAHEEFIVPVRNDEGRVISGIQGEQSALTIVSSELGNLISPNDREMMDLLTHLWDCRDVEKQTKKDGKEKVKNTWVNLIACTTPGWIAMNLPAYMIDGGLVSRCIWVYAEDKARYVAYPRKVVQPSDRAALADTLVADLQQMSTLCGEFNISEQAMEWGEQWYEDHFKHASRSMDDSRFKGYIARKQTHIHKLAMVLSVARSDDLIITRSDLMEAERHISAIEPRIPIIFDQMGKSKEASQGDRLLEYIANHDGVTLKQAYQHVHNYFPKFADFDAVLSGLVKSGLVTTSTKDGRPVLVVPKAQPDEAAGSPTRART